MGKTWTPQQIAQCLALYQQGVPRREIVRRMKGSDKAISKYVDLGGLPRRGSAQHGERNYFWKGGRYIDADGYVLIYAPDHPHRNHQNKVREHRLVMEKRLGRYLNPDEIVHHKNGVKDDNRPENLDVYPSNAAHLAVTLKGHPPKLSVEGRQRIVDANKARRTQRISGHPISGADQ